MESTLFFYHPHLLCFHHGVLIEIFGFFLSSFSIEKDSFHSSGLYSSESHAGQSGQNFFSFARRKLLEQASNLPAAPAKGESQSRQIIVIPMTRSSGAFPAVPKRKKQPSPAPSPLPSPAAPPTHNTLDPEGQPSKHANGFPLKPTNQPSSDGTSENIWKYIIIVGGVAVLLIVAAAMLCMWRSKAVTTIRPWKTGLSGQLQKAFITGNFSNVQLLYTVMCQPHLMNP